MPCFELNLDFGQTTNETSCLLPSLYPIPNSFVKYCGDSFSASFCICSTATPHFSRLKIISQIIIFIFRYIILLFSEVRFSGKVWAKLFSFCVLRRGYKKSGSRISSVWYLSPFGQYQHHKGEGRQHKHQAPVSRYCMLYYIYYILLYIIIIYYYIFLYNIIYQQHKNWGGEAT